MKSAKVMASLAIAALVAQAGVAAVRPSAATNLSAMPTAKLAVGARVGSTTNKSNRADLSSTGTAAVIGGTAALGLGIAAAAGAFDGNGHSTSP